jgi:LuxR family maltose regulon positive regulatory protein
VAFGWQDVPVCGMLHLALGELAYESNRLIEALLHLEKGVAMTRIGQMQFFNAWGLVLLAQTQLALKHEFRFSAMQEAELIRYSERFLIEIPPLSASLVQLWLHQHRFDHVQQWLSNAQLPVKGELVFERWAEYLVLCRYLVLQERYVDADELLDRLYVYAEQQQQRRLLIETLLIKALLQHQQHHFSKAASSLQQAIICAHDSKFLRLFAQESQLLHDLFPLISKTLVHHPLVDDLITLIPQSSQPHTASNHAVSYHLSLSKKERLVAKQIITGATSQEIAEMLCVSLSTIKTHTQNIYTKLGVNKRPQAIEMLLRLNLAT